MKDIKVLKATPMFNGVITTCHQWEYDGESDGLIDTAKSQGIVKPHQIVVAVGSAARNVKVGDLVIIDPTRFMKMRYNEDSLKNNVVKENEVAGFDFPIIYINNEPHMLLNENDISYIVNEFEEFEIESDSDLID